MRRAWRVYIGVGMTVAAMLLPRGVRADSVTAGGRQWTAAKLKWVQDGKLYFSDANGAQQSVAVGTIERLQVDLRDEFNRAEQLRASGRWDEAMGAYDNALRSETDNILPNLIRWRLMDLCGRTGQLDRAVELFVDLVKQPDYQQVVKDWRPPGVAAARPKVKASALATLDDALKSVRTGLASEYVRQLREYIAAGGSSRPSGQPGIAAPSSNGAEPADTTGGSYAGTWSSRTIRMIRAKQYAQALEAADRALAAETLPRDLLTDALFVRGVALWHTARGREQRLQAGWALARVLIEFPGSEHVPECLYYLGLVHRELGRPDMARQLLQQAQAASGASEDIRRQARSALANLAVEGK